jgi:hypothetical protein
MNATEGSQPPDDQPRHWHDNAADRGEPMLPASIESAWFEFAGELVDVDDRTRTLLRQAFERGYRSAVRRT